MKKAAYIYLVFSLCLILISCAAGKTETEFSPNSEIKDYVYVDVVSIVPEMGRAHGYQTDNDIICQCETTSGTTVWIAIDSSEYFQLDPDVEPGLFYVPVYYPEGLRIHGRVVSAEHVKTNVALKKDELIINYLSVDARRTDPVKESSEDAYSEEVKTLSPVYVDIVSIVPKATITISVIPSYPDYVLCACETKNGDIVQAYMTVNQYKQFDPDAKFYDPKGGFSFVNEVSFPDGLRIHGMAVAAEEISSSLLKFAPNMVIVFHSMEENQK
ncbi:MAG: hypothetical protein E7448_04300 [Ruminococcaceae bacterium]|nr:hypothetical protein [Oscillospiraceae bacterium]